MFARTDAGTDADMNMDEMKGRVVWHSSLFSLPSFPEGAIGNLIEKKKSVKFTSSRAYKFFLEGYIHDVKGEMKESPKTLPIK